MKIKFGIDDYVYESELVGSIKEGEWHNYNVDFMIKNGELIIDIATCTSITAPLWADNA